MKPWPKLFQNLRSTRETELAQQFPLHQVDRQQPVAAKHYLQVIDEHFEQAVKRDTEYNARAAKTATQNTTQPLAATTSQSDATPTMTMRYGKTRQPAAALPPP